MAISPLPVFLLDFRFCKSIAYRLDDALRTHCGSRYDIHISRLCAYHLRNYFCSNIVEMFVGIIILYNRNIGDFITVYGYTYLYARFLSRAFSRVYAVRVLACRNISRFFCSFFATSEPPAPSSTTAVLSLSTVVVSVSVAFPSVPPELQPPKTAKANNTDTMRLIVLFLPITLSSLPVQESYKRNLHEFGDCQIEKCNCHHEPQIRQRRTFEFKEACCGRNHRQSYCHAEGHDR